MTRARSSRRFVGWAALAWAVLLAGCAPPEFERTYGRRSGWPEGTSVNGTAVLAKMFEQAGWRVISRRRLTPALAERADCIVWFPDAVEPPPDEAVEWFESWLADKPRRTLLFVLRDYDAAAAYWRKVEPAASAQQRALVRTERDLAESRDAARRKLFAATADDYPWFNLEPLQKPQKVERLSGRQWIADVDPEQTEIELGCTLHLPDDARTLLEGNDEPLVAALPCGKSRILVVANGSFLLNLPLVNHEHRKLAGRLIAELQGAGSTAAFLESGRGGPPVSERDPTSELPSILSIFLVWPLNWILLHLTAAGIVFCLARWPIFGRPRDLPPPPLADFGQHVTALAEHLQQTGDIRYAHRRVRQWRERGGGKEEG